MSCPTFKVTSQIDAHLPCCIDSRWNCAHIMTSRASQSCSWAEEVAEGFPANPVLPSLLTRTGGKANDGLHAKVMTKERNVVSQASKFVETGSAGIHVSLPNSTKRYSDYTLSIYLSIDR